MNKKQWVKKSITGSVACALLLGGFAGGLPVKQAFAAEAVTASSTSPVINQHLKSIVRDTAWLADKAESVIYASLKQGQSLAEASGLSASELTDKLNSLLVEDINRVYEDSDASSTEIDALKNEGQNAIASLVTDKSFKPAAAAPAVDLNAIIQNQLQLVVSNAAGYSDQESSDIQLRVQDGQPVYQAANLSQAYLNSVLSDQLNKLIDAAVTNQHVAPSVVQAAKEEGAQLLAEVIDTGVVKSSNSTAAVTTDSVTSAVYARLDRIVADASIIADKDYPEVRDALQTGANLAQATGVSESILNTALTELMNKDIAKAAAQTIISDEKLNEITAFATQQIEALVGTANTNKASAQLEDDFKAKVDTKLNLAVLEAANLAEKELYSVEQALKEGRNLADATGLNGADLTQALQASVNEYIDNNAAGVNEDTLAQVKKDAAEYISNLVENGLSK